MSAVQEQILRQEHARLFRHVVGGRVFAIPLFAALALTIALVEPWGWRTFWLAFTVVMISCFFLFELFRYRRCGMTESAIPLNLIAAALGPLLLAAQTGGIFSPILFIMIPLAILVRAFLGPRLVITLISIQLACIWFFAILAVKAWFPEFNLQIFGGGPGLPVPPVYVYAHATFLSLIMLGAGQFGQIVKGTFNRILRSSLSAQQESLELHAERVRELTSLSAEIAHELKNPLASIKGLSALLSQNLPDGKPAERLKVLRGEVDRMQGILEEFLNFSRPLIPLSRAECDLTQVISEVVGMHEGMAKERAVHLVASDVPHSLYCDDRKLKQILINLVQNAIEASPPEAPIVIDCERQEERMLIRVIDQGRGVDEALGDVFNPGVTSKAQGSGLGLTIARSLARQHGGELALVPGEKGGTIAELSLPLRPQAVVGTSNA